MNTKTKKIAKITLSVILSLIIVLITIPFIFKNKIKEVILSEVNKQLTADVGFNKLKISLIKNFPNASIGIQDLYIAGRDKFEGDTLFFSKEIELVVNMKSIFSADGFEIKKVEVNNSKVFAHELNDESVNWDIVAENANKKEKESSSFVLKLQDVKLRQTDIIFVSDTSHMAATLDNMNVNLRGNFTSDRSLLKTEIMVDSFSFWNEGIRYAKNLSLNFDAEIDANFVESRYTLANNKIKINAIPLSLNGWVQLPDEGINMDLTLNAEQVDFKSLLSLIPAIYSNQFDKLTADGNINLNGFIKGKLLDDDYPTFDLNLTIENGKFSYPDLPKSVDNVQVKTHITHPGGLLDETVVDVSQLNFIMGGNPFSAKLNLTHLMTDLNFKVKADGKLDLGMIQDIYPLEQGTELNGVVQMNLDAAGKMSYIEQNNYENFKFSGDVNVQQLLAKTPDFKQPVSVSHAALIFSDRYLNLSDLKLKIGDNDFNINGKVENYLPYLLRDKTLKGEMNLQSNYLNLNDFMSNEKDTTALKIIEIPKNLNLALTGNFKSLVYNKMNLDNANAQLLVADGDLLINRMNVNAFGGNMILVGKYSTQNPAQPAVNFNLDIKQIAFSEILNQVESLQKFAPIFNKLSGKFNTELSLNTLLATDMMPILTSIVSSGKLKAETVSLTENITVLDELAKSLKIDPFNKLTWHDISLAFNIKEGKLETQPFNLKFKDYNLNLGGTTGLDQSIAYNGSLKMPDQFNLGKFQTIGFVIGGTFQKPTIKLDIKSTISGLVEEEKAKAMEKVDSIKSQIIDQGKAEREKALKEAQLRADIILQQADNQGKQLLNEARVQSDSIISKAKNPIAKELAKKASEELIKQAQKQADNINEKAKAEADKIIKSAEEKTELR